MTQEQSLVQVLGVYGEPVSGLVVAAMTALLWLPAIVFLYLLVTS